MELEKQLEEILHLTPRQKSALGKLGIKTVRDLLFHVPARYEEIGDIKTIGRLRQGVFA